VTAASSSRSSSGFKSALGATGGRLLRHLLTESLVLAVLGGGLGVLVANWGVDAILASIRGRLFTLAGDTPVVCGHGPDTTIEEEKKGNPFAAV